MNKVILIMGIPVWVTIFYLVFRLVVIRSDENGQTEKFGKPGRKLGPGLHVLGPTETLRRVPSGAIPIPVPGSNEEIQNEDQDNIKPGKVAPIRITHPTPENALFFDKTSGTFKKLKDFDPKEAEALRTGALSEEMTTQVTAFIMARIDADFIYEFFRYSGSIEEAIGTLMDITESAMTSDLGKVAPSQVTMHKDIFSYRLLVRLEEHARERSDKDWKPLEEFSYSEMEADLKKREKEGPREKRKAKDDSWGLLIDKVEIKTIDPRKTVNAAMSNAVAAKSKRREDILDSEARAQATINQGKADGEADKARGQGRAEAIKAWGKALQEPGAMDAAILETTEKVAASSKMVIVQNPMDLVTTALGKSLLEADKTPSRKEVTPR